ncbi:3358_t:CDS:2, partial [Racocetra fulgida]
MGLEIDKILHHEQSPYQDILIFKSKTYGNVLALDGVVLVIGGGDGGVLREVVKHDSVEEVVLCEIDEAVIRSSKKYLPGMATGFDNPKVKVHIGDGFPFLEDKINYFDIIITDSSDPVEEKEEKLFRYYNSEIHEAAFILPQFTKSALKEAENK